MGINRIDTEYQSIPTSREKYSYFYKLEKKKSYPIYYRVLKSENKKTCKAHVILDVNKIIKNGEYGNVSNIQISPCENYLMYCFDTSGNRKNYLFVKNIKQNISSLIRRNISSNFIWGRDKNEIFYSDMDTKTFRQNKIYVYNIKNKKRRLICEEYDEEFYLYVMKSKSNRFIFFV